MRVFPFIIGISAMLLCAGVAMADSYSLAVTTTTRQEQVLLKRYRRECLDRLTNGQALLPNCTAGCATCTPTNANKVTLLQDFLNSRLTSDVGQVTQRKADQTRDFYFNTPAQQGAIDAITGVADPDL